MRAAIPIELPFWVTIDVNAGVLLFAVGVSLLTGLLAGSLPALQATRVEFAPALNQTRSTSHSSRTRELLTVAQVSVSIMLLAGASMMLRGVMKLQKVDPGFDPRQTVMMEMNPTYNGDESAQVRVDRFVRLVERLREIPGVESVAANNSPPFVPQRPWNRTQITAEGQPVDEQSRNPLANFQTVSPDYFDLLRVPVIQGRVFETRDNLEATRVCLVSERLARRLWPNEQSIGKRLKLGGPDDNAHPDWLTVVGVVGDVRHQGLEGEAGS